MTAFTRSSNRTGNTITLRGIAWKSPERTGTVFEGSSVISMRRLSSAHWPTKPSPIRIAPGCPSSAFANDDSRLKVPVSSSSIWYSTPCCAFTSGASSESSIRTDRAQLSLTLQHARKARQICLQPILFRVAVGGQTEIVDHGIDVVFQLGDFAAGIHLNGPRQIALGHGRRDFGDGAHLVGQVVGQQVDVASKILPRSSGAWHVGLSTQTAFHTDFASDSRNLIRESGEGSCHVVDGFCQCRNFALGVHREFLGKVAVGDGRHDFDNAAHLLGEVHRHDVDVVGEILPRSSDARNLRLSFSVALRSRARPPAI